MAEEEKRQPAQEREAEQESGSMETAADDAGAELEKLQAGSKLSVGESDVPVPALVAIGIFVVVFMIVWMLLWAVLGGLGLGLGWIVAAVAGAGVVKLYADRREADPGAGSRREP